MRSETTEEVLTRLQKKLGSSVLYNYHHYLAPTFIEEQRTFVWDSKFLASRRLIHSRFAVKKILQTIKTKF